MKPQANIRLDQELLTWLKNEAKKDSRSFNNYIEIILKDFKDANKEIKDEN